MPTCGRTRFKPSLFNLKAACLDSLPSYLPPLKLDLHLKIEKFCTSLRRVTSLCTVPNPHLPVTMPCFLRADISFCTVHFNGSHNNLISVKQMMCQTVFLSSWPRNSLLLWNLKIHHHDHKGLLLFLILSHLSPLPHFLISVLILSLCLSQGI